MLPGPRLYAYVVTEDTGFSPNPFWGICTLAVGKPAIRRVARIGDWIIGLSQKKDGNRIIYAMKITDILTQAEYFNDPRFSKKIPHFNDGSGVSKCGDNIYKPLPSGGFTQLQSMHANGLHEDLTAKIHDLKGKNVLISNHFSYFGAGAIKLPKELSEIKVRRGHKSKFIELTVVRFLNFISHQPRGLISQPAFGPASDGPRQSLPSET